MIATIKIYPKRKQTMKVSQLRQLIREEVKKVLGEASGKSLERIMNNSDVEKLKGKTIKSFTFNKSKYKYTIIFTDGKTIYIKGNESTIPNPTAFKGKTIKSFTYNGVNVGPRYGSYTIVFTNNEKFVIPTDLIWELVPLENQPNQTPKTTPVYTKLAKEASDIYDDIMDMDAEYINSEAIDEEMEIIIKKVGHTPEQKKYKSKYKFAFGKHPEFETLTDKQLTKIIPFLKAVVKSKEFDIFDDWDGTKIVRDDEA